MSAESELLIKIKTVLESQGLDAAKSKLDELIEKTNSSAVSEAAANKERQNTTDKAEKTAQAIIAMNGAMEGGMGLFRAAIHVANQLGGSFAMMAFKASAVGAAITIGWKIGSTLSDWVTGAKEAKNELEKLQKASDELSARVKKLDDIRLSNLLANAKQIADGFATATDKAERLKRLSDLREDTQLAAALAENELKFQNKEITPAQRDINEINLTHDSQRRKLNADEKRINSESSIVDSIETQARGTYGDLSRKMGMAQQQYNIALTSYKDAGIDNPELLADQNSPLFKKTKIEKESSVDFKKNSLRVARENHSDQETIRNRESELSKAQSELDTLMDLPELKHLAEVTKKEFLAYKGVDASGLTKDGTPSPYKEKMDDVEKRREQLAAERDALMNNYDANAMTAVSKRMEIGNRISDESDKLFNDNRTPDIQKRDLVSELTRSLHMDPATIMNNAGEALSPEGQNKYDKDRRQQAQDLVIRASESVYNGADSVKLTDALIKALKQKSGAHVMLSEDQVKAIMDTIHELGRNTQAVSLRIQNMKSQIAVSKGTD